MARNQIRTDIVAKDRTKKAFASVTRAMKSLKKGALGIGVAVAALGAGLIAAAKKAVNLGDEIAKTADKIGLSTTALQELRVAADLAGISQGELDSALGAMSKRLGELRVETGALRTFLDKSDPAFKTLLQNTTNNDEAFRLIIEKLGTMTNAQDKAALSAAAFGRTAGIAIAKMSLDELDAGIAKAREFGLVIDENLLRSAEKIKDAFTIAGAAFQTQFMKAALTAMRDMDFKQIGEDLARLAIELGNAAMNLLKFVGAIKRSDLEIKTRELARLEGKMKDLIATLNAGGRRGINDNSTVRLLDTMRKKSLKLRAEIDKLRGTMAKPLPPIKQTRDVGFHAGEGPRKVAEEIKEVHVAAVAVKTPLSELARQSKDTFGQMQDIGVRAMNNLENSIMGIIDGTKSMKDAFKEMASSIISDLLRMQIKQHVTGPLSSLLGSGISSLFGGGFASGFAGAPALGFADGGYATGGRPAIVGERGPELIVPGRRGATVYPNESLGGSVNINQNFDFSGANPATVALLQQEAQRIKAETFTSVFQAIDRGGNYAKISGRR